MLYLCALARFTRHFVCINYCEHERIEIRLECIRLHVHTLHRWETWKPKMQLNCIKLSTQRRYRQREQCESMYDLLYGGLRDRNTFWKFQSSAEQQQRGDWKHEKTLYTLTSSSSSSSSPLLSVTWTQNNNNHWIPFDMAWTSTSNAINQTASER